MHPLIEKMIQSYNGSNRELSVNLASYSRGDSHEDLKALFDHIEEQTVCATVVKKGFSFHMAQPRCWAMEGSPAQILEIAARHGLMGGIIINEDKTYVIWPDIHFNPPV